MSLTFGSVIAAILTGAAVFYIRSCMITAERKRIAARRLHGYLSWWNTWCIDNNTFKFFAIGMELREQIEKMSLEELREGKSVEYKERKKEELKNQFHDGITNAEPESIDEIRGFLDNLPTKVADQLFDASIRANQDIVDGKTFVTDDEAAVIGRDVIIRCIELKSYLSEIIFAATLLIIAYNENPKGFDFVSKEEAIFSVIWKAVLIGEHSDYLEKRCESIEKTSLFQLTVYECLSFN